MSQFEVFLVEDNLDHAHLASECLLFGRSNIEVRHFADGSSLLAVLRARMDANLAMPHLLLLDLNMPGMNGFNILEVMKKSDGFRTIPAIVISTSNMTKDIHRALSLNANSYCIKSMDFETWEKSLTAIRDYWCDVDQSPRLRDLVREIQ